MNPNLRLIAVHDELSGRIDRIASSQPVKGLDGRDGQDGKDGKDGAVGKVGPRGQDGKNGKDGKDGKDGEDGVGVADASVDFDGHLTITLTDGNEIDAGDLALFLQDGTGTRVLVQGRSVSEDLDAIEQRLDALCVPDYVDAESGSLYGGRATT